MKPFLIGIILIMGTGNLYAQNQMDCIKQIQSGNIFQNENDLKEWIGAFNCDTIALINCLKDYYTDSLLSEKITQAIYQLKRISISSSNQKIKRAAVKFFLKISKSKDSGVSILGVKNLKSYPIDFFDNSDIDSVCILIEKYPTVYKEVVELAGYIGDPSIIATIRNVFPNSRHYSKLERWATFKSLARVGDKEALDYCISRVSALPLNDQVIDALYPDLIYIHKKESFDILIKTLNSDEKLCSSNNPNSDSKIICGYRIMELLAPEIAEIPVKILPSGDLDTKDYKKSLKKVRAWFAKKGNSYTIIN